MPKAARKSRPVRDERSTIDTLPRHVQKRVRKVVARIEAHDQSADAEENVSLVQERFENDLRLPHVSRDKIGRCLDGSGSLEDLAGELYVQTEKADRVFQMLDEAGKGVVVLEDLQRVASDALGGEVEDDDLLEMIQVIDQSGDGLLTRDDLVRVARITGL